MRKAVFGNECEIVEKSGSALDSCGYLWQGIFMMFDFAAGKTSGRGNGFPYFYYYYYYSRAKLRSQASSA
jgi:hypothetical protein